MEKERVEKSFLSEKCFSSLFACFFLSACLLPYVPGVRKYSLYRPGPQNLTGKNDSVLHRPVKGIVNKKVTVDVTKRLRSENCRLYPDILIAGFEKCGTLTLRSFLGTHPQLFKTNSKLNIPYFNSINSVNHVSFEEFTKDKPCTPAGKLRLEKISTNGSAVNVYETLSNVKLLVIVRGPVERAMSHHIHQIARKKEKNITFDTKIKSLLDGGTQETSKFFSFNNRHTSTVFNNGYKLLEETK